MIIDKDDFKHISKFNWQLYRRRKTLYAARKVRFGGQRHWVYMHRRIARTPLGMVCHHINQNGLDNRKANLVNMEKLIHTIHHLNNSFRVKFDRNWRGRPL